jgi:hypothetical protein
MNFFQRLFSFFRRPKPVQPAVTVLAPPPQNVAPAPQVVPVATVSVPIGTAAPPPQTEWRVHEKTIRYNPTGHVFENTYTVVEDQQTFATFNEAVAHANALMTKAEVDAYNQNLANRLGNLQPGEIDINSLTVEDCKVVAAFPHVFGGKVGPWHSVAQMVNWFQCQGGSPVNAALAAAYPQKDSQFMAQNVYGGAAWTSYTGQLRPILDQWAATKGQP